MEGRDPAEALRAAVCARDFAALDAVLARDADMRALLPGGLRAYGSPEAIVEAFRGWFGDAPRVVVEPIPLQSVGTRFLVGWRFRLEGEGVPTRVVAQTALVDVEDGLVYGIDLLCSGFEDDAAPSKVAVVDFDAGDLGCADGLAGEFRRRMGALDTGSVLRVTTRDPAAKEDLPPLARLLGHRVLGIEARPDGKTTIIVERRRT